MPDSIQDRLHTLDTAELESWEYLPLSGAEIAEAATLAVELPGAEVREGAPQVVVLVRQDIARQRTAALVHRHTTPVSGAAPRRSRR